MGGALYLSANERGWLLFQVLSTKDEEPPVMLKATDWMNNNVQRSRQQVKS